MRNIESPEVAMAVIGFIVPFAAILSRLASPRVAPYIEYAGLLLLAIGFLEITTMLLPVSWIIFPAAAAVLLLYAFVQAFRLKTEFITTVQQRGAAIIQARKLSSALSAASFACDHIRDWVLGTPKGTWVSMGVYSDGSYGIQPGLIYSFPITCEKGDWSIVQGLKIDEFSREKMDATAKELMEEKSLAYSCLK